MFSVNNAKRLLLLTLPTIPKRKRRRISVTFCILTAQPSVTQNRVTVSDHPRLGRHELLNELVHPQHPQTMDKSLPKRERRAVTLPSECDDEFTFSRLRSEGNVGKTNEPLSSGIEQLPLPVLWVLP